MGAGVAASPHCLEAFNSAPCGAHVRPRAVRALRRSEAPAAPRLPAQEHEAPGGSPVADPRTRRGDRPKVAARSGNSVRLRFRSAGRVRNACAPIPEAAAPSSRPALAADPVSGGNRHMGSGLAGARVRPLPVPPSFQPGFCRGAASAWPWLAPGCRCRGGFVSRPRLARSIPRDFPLRLWLGSWSVRFRPGRSGHARKLTAIPIRRKAELPVENKDNGDRIRARSGPDAPRRRPDARPLRRRR